MKSGVLLILTLLLAANCASRNTSRTDGSANVNQNAQPAASQSATPASANGSGEVAKEAEKEKEAPHGFRGVDFKNFSYPTSLRKAEVALKDGNYEVAMDMGGDSFDFRAVDYADLTGDGEQEAVVQLHRVSCGGSCDGGSHLFYIYSARQNRPRLLWRIESGSLAYGCGLKSFVVNQSTITLEAFRKCHLKSAFLAGESNSKELGKFQAIGLTRFIFEFDGKNFVLKKREVSPDVETDAKNYSPDIRISDD